ncbi:MAG: NIPSNAP family protein [Ginsengibacter sp.]
MSKILRTLLIIFSFMIFSINGYSKPTNKMIFQFRVYHLKDNQQVSMTDSFLQDALLPALHRFGIKNVGVFKPLGNDTAVDKLIYVLIPFTSLDQWKKISDRLQSDATFKKDGESFLQADAAMPPFQRMESILLNAFDGQPGMDLPKQKDPNRVFELRSYESPTPHLADRKRAMFNHDEMEIFARLGFNPVFYAEVISGSHMPNLMYMPVFKSVEDKIAQWKVFSSDPKWKEISADPKYENKVSVSHIDSIVMHATSYSDY